MSASKPLQTYFTLHCFDPPRQVGPEELQLYANEIGLKGIATGRISGLLFTQTIAFTQRYGIEPERFTAEIKHLEGVPGHEQSQTKAATPFNMSGRLAGLHHKHFTASTVGIVAANILAERPPKILMRIAEEELGNGATLEALQRFTERVVLDGYERRASTDRLTGEWIVFVEHEGKNHYLCLSTHEGADDEVLHYLRTVVRHEFPFLVSKLPHLFTP
jgi:hypothetical protein